jgi:hypothetical protein
MDETTIFYSYSKNMTCEDGDPTAWTRDISASDAACAVPLLPPDSIHLIP